LWEKEQFIQIKGIQKTQEAVNRNLRQLQLDKLRITRNKRIEEASDNIRRRRETQHQQTALKDVLNKIQRGEDHLHDEHHIKDRFCLFSATSLYLFLSLVMINRSSATVSFFLKLFSIASFGAILFILDLKRKRYKYTKLTQKIR
jgi:hypothetical protein